MPAQTGRRLSVVLTLRAAITAGQILYGFAGHCVRVVRGCVGRAGRPRRIGAELSYFSLIPIN
jgi:hypothetical protein